MKKKKKPKDLNISVNSNNIFADIGIKNPEEELTKAELVWEIEKIIKKKKLTQAMAAELIGISQPKISAVLHRKLAGFSVERLMHFLTALGQDIDIVVKPKPRSRKNARVSVYGSQGSFSNKSSIAAKAY